MRSWLRSLAKPERRVVLAWDDHLRYRLDSGRRVFRTSAQAESTLDALVADEISASKLCLQAGKWRLTLQLRQAAMH